MFHFTPARRTVNDIFGIASRYCKPSDICTSTGHRSGISRPQSLLRFLERYTLPSVYASAASHLTCPQKNGDLRDQWIAMLSLRFSEGLCRDSQHFNMTGCLMQEQSCRSISENLDATQDSKIVRSCLSDSSSLTLELLAVSSMKSRETKVELLSQHVLRVSTARDRYSSDNAYCLNTNLSHPFTMIA
jgi:hypothetical protein